MSDAPKLSGSWIGEISSTHRVTSALTRSRPMIVALLGSALIFLGVGFPGARFANEYTQYLVVIPGVLILFFSSAIELMTYLQSTKRSEVYSGSDLDKISQENSVQILSDLKSVKKDIENIKNSQSNVSFNKEEKNAIVERVTEKLTQDVVDRLSYNWEKKFKKASSAADNIREIGSTASDMKARLRQEVETLSKRANVNLTFGVMISLVGISILSYFIYVTTAELSSGLNTVDVFIRFAIRFSLAAFIQIFAYFFLRLYRYSIFETKYFQNEITNIDSRFLALQTAIFTEDKSLLSALSKELAKTERNFIIKKGDTTVGLRREEMEIDFETNLISRIERLSAIKDAKSAKKDKPGDE